MSIVYEYLKQIQQQKEPLKAATKRGAHGERGSQFPYAAVSMWVLIGLVVLVAICLMVPRSRTQSSLINVYKPKEMSAARISPPGAGYVLEGIIYNPAHPFAIINGQMIERNGRIDDFVVTSITPNAVSLKNSKDNTGRTLQL